MTGMVAEELIAHFSIRGSAFEHAGADAACGFGDAEVIQPGVLGRWAATDKGEVVLFNGICLKQGAAFFGGAFVEGGEENAGGVLIKPMNQPDFACGAIKAFLIEVVAAFKGAADFGVDLG